VANPVPVKEILVHVQSLVREDGWLYGTHATAVERWDLRRFIDYAASARAKSFTEFYRYSTGVYGVLCSAWGEINHRTSDKSEFRMWQTEKDRTQMDIEILMSKAIEYCTTERAKQ